MKTKLIKISLVTVLLTFGGVNCFSQGFVNLNFEQAIILTDAGSIFYADAGSAFPGWTAYISGVPQTSIFYNTVPLGAAEVTLQGTNNGVYSGGTTIPVVQGEYFAMLWGQFNPQNYPDAETNTAALGQTGQIPGTAQSISFWGTIGGMQVTFNGQPIDFIVTGSTANYTIYTADISAYAGQTGLLLFTDPCYGNTFGGPATIDNIRFSSTAVPEPSTFALTTLGGWLIGCRRWRQLSAR